MISRLLKLAMLGGGLGLFAWLLTDVNLGAVAAHVARIGWLGATIIVLAFSAGFAADVMSWLYMFRSIAMSWVWAWRLLLVQLVGEALNVVTPLGSLGGEPFKGLLLKRHYDISYSEGAASLLLVQTVNSLAMVPFVIVGALLSLGRGILSPGLELAVLAAAVTVGIFMLLVYGALHLRLLASLEQKLGQSRWAGKLAKGLAAMREIDEHLFVFVRHTPRRFAASLIFSFLNWLFGAIEMYLIFYFLGHPIGFADAWMVEATVVLVRAATFFIPGHLGVQDGAIALMGQGLAGTPEIGITVALLRRGRELAWAAVGLAIGGWFGLKKRPITT
jgi:glycosyltransferase 2 family protein